MLSGGLFICVSYEACCPLCTFKLGSFDTTLFYCTIVPICTNIPQSLSSYSTEQLIYHVFSAPNRTITLLQPRPYFGHKVICTQLLCLLRLYFGYKTILSQIPYLPQNYLHLASTPTNLPHFLGCYIDLYSKLAFMLHRLAY